MATYHFALKPFIPTSEPGMYKAPSVTAEGATVEEAYEKALTLFPEGSTMWSWYEETKYEPEE
jgi:hypothetical protein